MWRSAQVVCPALVPFREAVRLQEQPLDIRDAAAFASRAMKSNLAPLWLSAFANTFLEPSEERRALKSDASLTRGLVGQWGVFATRSLSPGDLLVEYGGLVTAMAQHLPRSLQDVRHSTDEKTLLLTHSLTWAGSLGELADGQPNSVVIDGSFFETIGARFNDYRLDPFARRNAASDPLPRSDGPPPNCTFVELVIQGWPYAFVVCERPVTAGEELTIDYGDMFWESMRCQRAFDASPTLQDRNGNMSLEALLAVLSRL